MSSNLLSTNMGRFRVVAMLEGISYLLLLGVAMPLKYMADMPLAVRYVGMTHGVLVIAFVMLLYFVHTEHKWSIKRSAIVFVASLLPFGAFWADKKYLKGN